MAITASEARSDPFGLIERVNLDQTAVEIISKRGSAMLTSKDEYDALVDTAYLLRSPTNTRRLIDASVTLILWGFPMDPCLGRITCRA
ncbi:type II toxin-antitoxin system Phd/YefM family antitoxin [Leifsonia sp. 2MCAF36]|uniref:type II toxin-antitoxin system Phd/YefM family antitoxin n=1 Tax=Leifsonia sp. 2MCAF36 TaxID=3232988 RepID=UPI003F945CA6